MPSRSNRADVITAAALLAAATAVLVGLVLHNPYRSTRGLREVREFVGRPPSVAEAALGRPARDFSYRLGDGLGRTLRGNVARQRPDLPRDTPVRELSWDEGNTFLTVWYRVAGDQTVAIFALQWDKSVPDWSTAMAAPPPAGATPPGPQPAP